MTMLSYFPKPFAKFSLLAALALLGLLSPSLIKGNYNLLIFIAGTFDFSAWKELFMTQFMADHTYEAFSTITQLGNKSNPTKHYRKCFEGWSN